MVIISLLLSLWATAAALIISGLFCFGVSFTLFPQEIAAACFNLGISAFCIGLGCLLTAGMVKLTQLSFQFLKWMFQKLQTYFIKKQDVLAEGVLSNEIISKIMLILSLSLCLAGIATCAVAFAVSGFEIQNLTRRIKKC